VDNFLYLIHNKTIFFGFGYDRSAVGEQANSMTLPAFYYSRRCGTHMSARLFALEAEPPDQISDERGSFDDVARLRALLRGARFDI
jgi:hypothetical protein